jgi:hypothetical protein
MQLDSRLEKYIPLQLEPVAIRLTAHIRLQRQIGRYGPLATFCNARFALLFDDLLAERHKTHRRSDAFGICGLEVGDQGAAYWLLERQIARPCLSRTRMTKSGAPSTDSFK